MSTAVEAKYTVRDGGRQDSERVLEQCFYSPELEDMSHVYMFKAATRPCTSNNGRPC